MKRALVAAASVLTLGGGLGCSIPLSATVEEVQTNSCTDSTDCAEGSACKQVGQESRCVATDVDLDGLILVLSPVASSTSIASIPFILTPGDTTTLVRDDPTGFVASYWGQLDALSDVHFNVAFSCKPGDDPHQIPFTAVLTRASSVSGLPPLTVTADLPEPDHRDKKNPWQRNASVPPGHYTAYVQPDPTVGTKNCLVPPPTVLPVEVSASGDTTVGVKLDGYLTLSGSIITKHPALTGWQVDVLEADGGRSVSQTKVLQPDVLTYAPPFTDLRFNWSDKSKSPIIRLRPPEGVVAPSVYWQLASALGASSSYDVSLSIGDFDPTATRHVEVVALANAATGGLQVASLITFQSESILGLDSPSTFSLTAASDDKGIVAADLPPGSYWVTAVPLDPNGLGIGRVKLDVPAKAANDPECFCGHTIPLPPKAVLSGDVTTATGEPLVDAPVAAVPSQQQAFAFDSLMADGGITPRASSGQTGADGRFAVGIDAGGLLDVSIQPAASSGYPWLVVSQVQAPLTGSQRGSAPLRSLTLPPPAFLSGRIVARDGTGEEPGVTNATLHAYLPVNGLQDLSGQPIVVEIGTATTDSEGNYLIALPPKMAKATTP